MPIQMEASMIVQVCCSGERLFNVHRKEQLETVSWFLTPCVCLPPPPPPPFVFMSAVAAAASATAYRVRPSSDAAGDRCEKSALRKMRKHLMLSLADRQHLQQLATPMWLPPCSRQVTIAAEKDVDNTVCSWS